VSEVGLVAIGAVAAGLPQLLAAIAQSLSARGQRTHDADADKAAAQREADIAAAAAERERERRAERANQIREWRVGLAAAHTEYRTWYAKRDAQGVSRVAEPNIVGAVWFQSLRRHLLETGRSNYYRSGDDIQCDDDTADVLGGEIARIEQEWLGD
jgi:hypothetical protein